MIAAPFPMGYPVRVRSLPQEGDDAARLLAIVTGSWKTQAVYVAARLGIADHLAESPRTAAELAAATETDPASLGRLLRALATLELVIEREEGTFASTPLGALLESGAPDSLRSWVLLWGGRSWPAWGHLLHSVKTGESARPLVDDLPGFSELGSDADRAGTFHRAMVELTRLIAREFVQSVDWSETRRIVDVGGGHGELLVAALGASPGAVGVLFDQPHAIPGARAHLRAAGMEERCEFVAGSFFEQVPEGGDTYLLKSVLHDWLDARAADILRACRRAMSPPARLLVIERIAPSRPGTSPDDQSLAGSDLHMLVQHAGRERTERELRALLSESGFAIGAVTPLQGTLAVISAVPSEGAIA